MEQLLRNEGYVPYGDESEIDECKLIYILVGCQFLTTLSSKCYTKKLYDWSNLRGPYDLDRKEC